MYKMLKMQGKIYIVQRCQLPHSLITAYRAWSCTSLSTQLKAHAARPGQRQCCWLCSRHTIKRQARSVDLSAHFIKT